jgi:hypothetical protein
LGVLIYCCITGELPFGMKPVGDDHSKAEVRSRLANPKLLWRSSLIQKLPKIQMILRECFISPAHLRPSANVVSNALLESFTELSYAKSLSMSNPEEPSIELFEIKDRCYKLVLQARQGQQTSTDIAHKVTKADVKLLAISIESDSDHDASADPLCSFLIGAIVWWRLVENSQCIDLFGVVDGGEFFDLAYFFPDLFSVSRAKFAIEKITLASTAGFLDGNFELSKAHKYLAAVFAESYASRKALFNEEVQQEHSDLSNERHPI